MLSRSLVACVAMVRRDDETRVLFARRDALGESARRGTRPAAKPPGLCTVRCANARVAITEHAVAVAILVGCVAGCVDGRGVVCFLCPRGTLMQKKTFADCWISHPSLPVQGAPRPQTYHRNIPRRYITHTTTTPMTVVHTTRSEAPHVSFPGCADASLSKFTASTKSKVPTRKKNPSNATTALFLPSHRMVHLTKHAHATRAWTSRRARLGAQLWRSRLTTTWRCPDERNFIEKPRCYPSASTVKEKSGNAVGTLPTSARVRTWSARSTCPPSSRAPMHWLRCRVSRLRAAFAPTPSPPWHQLQIASRFASCLVHENIAGGFSSSPVAT